MFSLKLKPISLAVMTVVAATSVAYAADAIKAEKVEVISSTPLDSTGIPLSQVPSNVQIIKSKEIKEQGASNLADLLDNNVGSVSLSNGVGNPYQNDVSYRGFQATSLLGAPVGLSVYVDGVRFNEAFGSNINWDLIPMNAVSGINLMPGSNPLFGLNTLGGALAVNTKNGADNEGFSATLLGGSFGRAALNFEAGVVDKDHNLDYFVAGNKDRQDGWRNHSSSDVQQLFGKVRWHSDDNRSNLDLSVALADNTLNGTQALPMSMLGNPKQAYTWPDTIGNRMAMFNLKGSTWLSDTKMVATNVYYRKQDSNAVNSNAQLDDGCGVSGTYQSRSGGYTKACSGNAPDGTARNAGGVTSGIQTYDYAGIINTSNVYSNTNQDTVGGSVQFTALDDLFSHANNLVVGAAGDYSHITYNQNTQLARLVNYQTVSTPDLKYIPTVFTNNGLINNVNLSANTSNFSIFGTNNFAVNDKLNVTASGSYNVAFVDMSGASNTFINSDGGATWTGDDGVAYANSAYNPVSTATVGTPATAAGYQYGTDAYGNLTKTKVKADGTIDTTYGTAGTLTYKRGVETASLGGNHHYSRFNPSVGFNFNPSNELGFFGGYNESMRAPTPIELNCANPDTPCNLPTGFNGDPDLKAVVAKTFEAGVRGKLLDNKVTWNAAIYDTNTYNDIQFVSDTPTTGYFKNVGQTERKGFEFGVQGKFDKLLLAASYGYIDATFQSSFVETAGSNSVALAARSDQVTVSKGNKIPGIADQTLKFRAAYEVTPAWRVGSNVMLASGQYAHGDENNQDSNGKVPGYGVVNLDSHYDINEHWTAFGLVNNLFDKNYYTYGMLGVNIYDNPTASANSAPTSSVNQQFRTPATERAVWFGVTYNFSGKKSSPVDRD